MCVFICTRCVRNKDNNDNDTVLCAAILSRCGRINSEVFAIEPFYSLEHCTKQNYNDLIDN